MYYVSVRLFVRCLLLYDTCFDLVAIHYSAILSRNSFSSRTFFDVLNDGNGNVKQASLKDLIDLLLLTGRWDIFYPFVVLILEFVRVSMNASIDNKTIIIHLLPEKVKMMKKSEQNAKHKTIQANPSHDNNFICEYNKDICINQNIVRFQLCAIE